MLVKEKENANQVSFLGEKSSISKTNEFIP
jgi:hypothetical protein